MGYNLLINGIYLEYNLLTNHLLTSWDIQAWRLLNWVVLSDELKWALWMTIFPTKWRANEQQGEGWAPANWTGKQGNCCDLTNQDKTYEAKITWKGHRASFKDVRKIREYPPEKGPC